MFRSVGTAFYLPLLYHEGRILSPSRAEFMGYGEVCKPVKDSKSDSAEASRECSVESDH